MSRREALIEKYVARPRTHQLALDQADATIRTSSPVRYPPARRFEHVVTSAFGAGGEPAIPKGADNDWCTKGLVIAGESCSPVLRRLSHPTNYTQSYAKRRSYPHVVDLQELPAFPRYSERDTEFLESIKIRKFIAEERRNPEVMNTAPVWGTHDKPPVQSQSHPPHHLCAVFNQEKGNFTNVALWRQSLRYVPGDTM